MYIVIVFTGPASDILQFNYMSSGGPDNLYNNIIIYELALSQSIVTDHYNLYVGRPSSSISEPAVSLTELALDYYDNDWIVIQST